MSQTQFIQKFWTTGYQYRKITGKASFIQCVPDGWQSSIEIREYPFCGIDDCFNPEDGWKPCTADEFVIAYCNAINKIAAASGIEHLPLICETINQTENY